MNIDRIDQRDLAVDAEPNEQLLKVADCVMAAKNTRVFHALGVRRKPIQRKISYNVHTCNASYIAELVCCTNENRKNTEQAKQHKWTNIILSLKI